VVQVPLLRCASDKRRAGKLGADRMREYREGRKGWVAMVREWEREWEREVKKGKEGQGERDAEGERDDDVGPSGGQGNGNGSGAAIGNGEPSALDVALLLPPTEMPALMLKEGFFTGSW
jgi:hypothetical protein